MKIAITSNGTSTKDSIDPRFGRCKYFIIYDSDTQEYKTIENEGYKSNGGAGIASANQLINQNVDILITGNLGPNAFRVIGQTSIQVYQCNSNLIIEAIELLDRQMLTKIETPGPAHQ